MSMQFHDRTNSGSGKHLGLLYLDFHICYFLYVPFTKLIFSEISQETMNAARILILLNLS
jgi:hypothetical protein